MHVRLNRSDFQSGEGYTLLYAHGQYPNVQNILSVNLRSNHHPCLSLGCESYSRSGFWQAFHTPWNILWPRIFGFIRYTVTQLKCSSMKVTKDCDSLEKEFLSGQIHREESFPAYHLPILTTLSLGIGERWDLDTAQWLQIQSNF